ncbi:hypothetical protein DB346_02215 [Verrucomicrobia bacterium LW23]|nr:hypothetical protein DB346_02215 [Verrucomicrobia bacterium LW23]
MQHKDTQSWADVRHVFLLALLSFVGLLGAFAGSYTEDGLDDAWKVAHQLSTNVTAETSLAGWWQVNETGGLAASDRSTNGLALVVASVDGAPVAPEVGAPGGVLWKLGVFDSGAELGGTYYLAAQVVGAPGQAAYGLGGSGGSGGSAGDFTFSAWVRTGAVPEAAGDLQVIGRWLGGNGLGWELGTAPNGQLIARFRTSSGGEQVLQAAVVEGLVKDGGWHQAALVYVGATGEARLFLDGRLEATRLVSGGFGAEVTDFRIGDKGWGGVSWKGAVDEIRLYKKALSDSEVASLPITHSDLPDGDGLSVAGEAAAGTHLGQKDSDGDGVPDGAEVVLGLNPTDAADAAGVAPDGAGLTWLQVYRQGLATGSGPAAAVSPDHLVGYWPFELNSTNGPPQLSDFRYVFDHSASAQTGRLRGVADGLVRESFGAGKLGNALVLEGSGRTHGFVEVKPDAARIWGDFTVSAWIRTADTSNHKVIFQRLDEAGLGWQLDVAPSGKVRARVDTDVLRGQVVQNLGGGVAVADAQWHHVALSFSASGRTALLYVDGNLEASRQITGAYGVTAKEFSIGRGWGAHWRGSLDEVRLWDSVLTPQQMATVRNAVTAGDGTGSGGSGMGGTGTGGNGSGGNGTGGGSGSGAGTEYVPGEPTVGERLTAIVRHRPNLNSRIDGSVQMLLGEDVSLNWGGVITGDLLVPGVPQVTLNGQPPQITYGGIKTGTGAETPTNFRLTINHGGGVRYLTTRIDPVTMPTVAPPANPTGTRSVSLNGPSDTTGDWATVRDLNCNASTGTLTVPPGVYGSFTINNQWTLKLGTAPSEGAPSATEPAMYEFQALNLNSQSVKIEVLGPVEIRLRNDLNTSATVGNEEHPEWLTLKVSNGGVGLNSGGKLYGHVVAPSGTVNINSGTVLKGTIKADQLNMYGGEMTYAPAVTVPPPDPDPVTMEVALTAPAAGSLYESPAQVELAGTATTNIGVITKVEFYAAPVLGGVEGDAVKIGEDASAPYTYTWAGVPAGTYALTAVATHSTGPQAASAATLIVVRQPDIEPEEPVPARVSAFGDSSLYWTGGLPPESGKLKGWGANSLGQLGLTPATDVPQPVALETSIGAISSRGGHTLFLVAGGSVKSVGDNYFGQLGTGSRADASAPQSVPGLTNITAVAAGQSHSLALDSTGRVWVWGSNASGQLGLGAPGSPGYVPESTAPVPLADLANVVAIAAGQRHSVALTSDGHVYTWGEGKDGQLGLGDAALTAWVPAQVPAPGSTPVSPAPLAEITALVAGEHFTLTLSQSGTLYGWGANGFGQLGLGHTSRAATPQAVSALAGITVTAVAAGAEHTVVLTNTGALYTFGNNASGQLGTGDTADYAVPVLLTLTDIAGIASGWDHTLIVKADGTVLGTGANARHQLGDGTTNNKSMPTSIGTP